jgi:hypothetical protein
MGIPPVFSHSELKTKGKKLVLGSDGNTDSPDHLAKYGSYTMMELQLNAVINIELVQVIICVFTVCLSVCLSRHLLVCVEL